MNQRQPEDHPSVPNWQAIRAAASRFPEPAYQFVREGLAHTVKAIHGKLDEPQRPGAGLQTQRSRHVDGRQLALGLRDFAIRQYGPMAGTVMRKWGISRTQDFGTIVYAMIDKGEMRASSQDDVNDFNDVFDFEEAFVEPLAMRSE